MSTHTGTYKKLSFVRLTIALLVLGLIGTLVYYGLKTYKAQGSDTSMQAWFASYVDVTATPQFAFENLGTGTNKDAVLSFIVSSPSSACTPSWGGAYTLDQADSSLDVGTRIARLQQLGGSVAISFGGRNNEELADGCTNVDELESAYQSVVERYNINTIDFDIEGTSLSNTQADTRRAIAVAKLQTYMRHHGKHLAVWLTLPVTPDGLTTDGTNTVTQFLTNGVDLAGVNILAMDYGSSLGQTQTMASGAEDAMNATQHQLGILYQINGTYLNSTSLWAKIGVTPMIGQNDFSNEVFTLQDAQKLNAFALGKKIGRMSMWSANRDITCGSNYVDTSIVSDSCSGVNEGSTSFSAILSSGFDGSITLSSGLITKADEKSAQLNKPDNPATSPYQIWSATGAYLEGTKVVWHHNIYIAKWWTQGDIPDNPVLQSYETPWELIGPVLPGETPIPQPTLPEGTYPDWSGTAIYNAGERVLFNGIPYQAKWWNQGDSPAAASSDASDSPWTPLTQDQIDQIEGN